MDFRARSRGAVGQGEADGASSSLLLLPPSSRELPSFSAPSVPPANLSQAAAQNVRPARIGGSISWLSPTLAPNSSTPFPPYPLDWVSLLESHFTNSTLHLLTPSPAFLASNTSIAELLRDPRERVAKRQVNEGLISTFWGHSRVIRMIAERGHEAALIL